MLKRFARTFACVLTLLCATVPLFGSSLDFKKVTAAEMKTVEVPGHPNAPAIIFEREQIDNDQINAQTVYVRMKVLTEAGIKFARVDIPPRTSRYKIGSISARTIQPDGTIVRFTGNAVERKVARSRWNEVPMTSFTLPDVRVGSILEYKYVVQLYEERWGQNLTGTVSPEFKGVQGMIENRRRVPPLIWSVEQELYQQRVKFVYIPPDFEVITDRGEVTNSVGWTSFLPGGAEVKVNKNGRATDAGDLFGKRDRRTFELELKNLEPLQVEEHMPSPEWLTYNVRFYYQPRTAPGEFWRAEGAAWNKETDNFISKHSGLQEIVAQVVSPTDTADQKLRKLYRFAQSFKNLSYGSEIDSANEAANSIRNVEDVIRLKRGRHDDITRLFVAMVRTAGIPAHLMAVTSRDRWFFTEKLLSWSQLTHEIAIVGPEENEIYLDPGTVFCPYGQLPWNLIAARGVRQKGEGTVIADTPIPDVRESAIQKSALLELKPDGTVSGSLRVVFTGQEALQRRLNLLGESDETRNRKLEEEILSWLPTGATASVQSIKEWNNSELPIAATFNITAKIVTVNGSRMALPAQLLEFAKPARFVSAERKNPVCLDFPSMDGTEIHLKIPPGLAIESIPTPQEVRPPFGVYLASIGREGEGLVMKRTYALAGAVFDPEQYRDLKSFHDAVSEGDRGNIVLVSRPGTTPGN